MKITTHLVIKHFPCRFEPDKPYVLYIVENNRVGDKLNFDTGYNGKSFPSNAAERFETKEEAIEVYYKFLDYVNDKILQAKKNPAKANKSKPSYYLWE